MLQLRTQKIESAPRHLLRQGCALGRVYMPEETGVRETMQILGEAMIVLPWPDKALSPNSRVHWSQKAKAAKLARNTGHLAAMAAGYNLMTFDEYEGKLHLWIDYYAKTRNYPDADNCLGATKNFLDGIADAIGINDRRFVHHPLVKDETHKGGKVVIRITKEAT